MDGISKANKAQMKEEKKIDRAVQRKKIFLWSRDNTVIASRTVYACQDEFRYDFSYCIYKQIIKRRFFFFLHYTLLDVQSILASHS